MSETRQGGGVRLCRVVKGLLQEQSQKHPFLEKTTSGSQDASE
jgi:hypothetical protein